MKDQLYAILSKYPFIHIDKVGELSMLVPLTLARTVSFDFTPGTEKATSLYVFGDNTCKSDLERTLFFDPPAGGPKSSFNTLFYDLIKELKDLILKLPSPQDQQIIQGIIKLLEKQRPEVDKLKEYMPQLSINKMRDDLCVGTQGFVTKGEFVVQSADTARFLNLPSVLNLILAQADREKILPNDFAFDNEIASYLKAIPNTQDKNALETSLQHLIKNKGIHACRQELAQNPTQLFRSLYYTLKNSSHPKLIAQPENFFDVLTENLGYLVGENENYHGYNEKDLVGTIKLIFSQTLFFNQADEEQKSFSSIYHQTLTSFETINKDNEEKTNSFKLFSIQTFLFLCTLQLRFKNMELAKEFLKALQNSKSAKSLIGQLCKNETKFKQMLQEKYGFSAQEYDALVDSTFKILTDHVEAPHFDELRVSCLSAELENTHYLVLGGRLCWSTAEITEDATINSEEQKKRKFDANFEQFFEHIEAYLDRPEHLSTLRELLTEGEEYEEEAALQSLEFNATTFSFSQKKQLLELAIQHNKYQCAAFLVNQGVYDERLFQLAYAQHPANTLLISSFVRANNNYMSQCATEEHLIHAIFDGRLDRVKIILTVSPHLLDSQLCIDSTPLLLASNQDRAEIVDYLMSIGVNTLASGTTQRQITAKDNAMQGGNEELIRLFTDYHLRVREQLEAGTDFAFLSTPEYFFTALKQQEHQLVEVLLEFFPELQNEFTSQCLIDAIKDKSLPLVQAILALKPELLNECNDANETALFYACQLNDVSIVQHLIDAGADIFMSVNGKLPRDAASNTEVSDLFIPSYQRLAPNSEQYKSLFTSDNYREAIRNNDLSLAHCIHQKYPEFADEIIVDDLYATRFPEAIAYIFSLRDDLIEHKDPRNKTPFYYACEHDNSALAAALITAGANIHAGVITAVSPTSYSGYTIRRAAERNNSPAIKGLLASYNDFLPQIKEQNISSAHIIDAIDARNLVFVTYFLNKRPELTQELSEVDLKHIEQQEIQQNLYNRYKLLLDGLKRKRDQFSHSQEENSPYQVLNKLSTSLNNAGDQFFNTHISENTVKEFETACNQALVAANPVLSIHRGWHGFPLWMRAIVGIIAAATLLPAITVQATTTKGYVGTFFKSYETDSEMHTKKFSSELDSIKTELISVL
ncbi:ankyrin repeat domain-containing protein [Legionella lytica]|uniref:Ankyrin repeat domain-containing protein n=1 Tax=Legionella lytica TaxID=96232 RepID=A0ABW8D3C1_9GAMM